MKKKILSIVMTIALLAGMLSCGVVAYAESGKVKFALSTDLHIENNRTELEVSYPESELYFNAGGSGNIYDQASTLAKTFLNNSAREGVDFVLVAGDLTRNGTREQHEYTADLLARFEKKTGIPVYVVPGNHDYFNSEPADFKEIYASLGYDEAIVSDSKTASYTADLKNDYRLIAVDSNNPGEDGDGVDARLLRWVKAQTEAAAKDGKRIIYMMHHPLLEHLPLGKVLMKDFMLRNSELIAEMFCTWGIEYVFTGHEHGNDIASYKGLNGKTVYDVLTTALSSYPIEYRMVTMDRQGADIKMRSIDKCNISALVPGYTKAQISMLKKDYNGFAYGIFRYSIEKKILHYVSPEFIKNKLKVTKGPAADEIDALFGAIDEALEMPIYESEGGKKSMQALAALKGVNLPETKYGSLLELASALVAAHYYGNENLPAPENPEAELFTKCLNTGLEYVFTKTGRTGITLLASILTQLGVETDTLSPVFTAVKFGKEDSYKVAAAVLNPLLNRFLVDFSCPDRDACLAAN